MARSKVRKPDEWNAILEGLRSSGLTQKQYAAQVGCHPSSFGWWRKRLLELDSPSQSKSPAFIELRAAKELPTGSHMAGDGSQVRLQSKTGASVSFASLPPVDYLARLLCEV